MTSNMSEVRTSSLSSPHLLFCKHMISAGANILWIKYAWFKLWNLSCLNWEEHKIKILFLNSIWIYPIIKIEMFNVLKQAQYLKRRILIITGSIYWVLATCKTLWWPLMCIFSFNLYHIPLMFILLYITSFNICINFMDVIVSLYQFNNYETMT